MGARNKLRAFLPHYKKWLLPLTVDAAGFISFLRGEIKRSSLNECVFCIFVFILFAVLIFFYN